MAGNSLESLLLWMKNPNNNVMWGWDAIAVMARSKTNTLLMQEYIARFTVDSYLTPISEVVPITPGETQYYLHDFVLDAPRLSFERLDPSDPNSKPRAVLSCSIMGGIQIGMTHKVDHWQVTNIVETDPLQGPRLMLDLNLEDVHGDVATGGEVSLDLSTSDHFRLSMGGSEIEESRLGNFFREVFIALPHQKKVWVLGHIAAGTDELMRPQSFRLSTQANSLASRDKRAESYGDGAVQIFVRMVGSSEGGGLPAEYKYLIPDDAGKDYSATVLFKQERVLESVAMVDNVLEMVAGLIGSHDFAFENDADGKLVKATAKGGALEIPPSTTNLLPIPINGTPIITTVNQSPVTFSAAQSEPLSVFVEPDQQVYVFWRAVAEGTTTCSFSGGDFEAITRNIRYELEVNARYSLIEENDSLIIKPGLSVTVDGEEIDGSFREGEADWLILLAYVVAQLALLAQGLIKPRVIAALDKQLNAAVSIDSFIEDSVKLTFGQAIVGDTLRAPRDIGFFGKVNPVRTLFTVNPLEPVIIAEDTRQFATDPVGARVRWSVRNLFDDVTPALGRISLAGVYEAPAASAINGRYLRERVVAESLDSGHFSAALVTVVVNPMTLNPLIQLCDITGTVEVVAGALGDGALQWSVRNPVEDQRGTIVPSVHPDGDHTYIPHEKVAESKLTYVLDEIVVTGAAGSRSVWVLVQVKDSMLVVKPLKVAGQPANNVQLQAFFDDELESEVEWSFPLIKVGSIDADGLYKADPLAPERFVLIVATLQISSTRKYEGHIILPLPLDVFPEEVDLMML